MISTNPSPFTTYELPNGLKVVVEKMPGVRSVAAGFMVRAGARDESAPLAGVSHFLEHMMFKGTSRRGWREINIDFDRMGSTYNAFTSETRTVYYGWVRTADLEPQVELLADMMRSQLPSEEFTMEKNVILEEIAMSKDQIEHVAMEFLQEKIFANHPLAWPILGYESTIRDLTRDQMWAYFQQRYTPDRMHLVVAGNVDPAQVADAAYKYCGHWPRSAEPPARTAPIFHGGRDVLTQTQFKQQILCLSFPGPSATHELAETADAAMTILGGDNSRFFWNIVQKGISPRAGSFQMDYEDAGLVVLWGACQPEHCEALLESMRREAARICAEPVLEDEVQRVKTKQRTSLAVAGEAPYSRLSQMMDDLEYRGYARTVDELLADVDAISTDTIHRYFKEFPINIEGHLASVGPRSWPTE